MVPTVDTVRYNFLVGALIKREQPVMLVGPVGTGKTSVAQSVCGTLDSQQYSVLTINMSAQTTSNNVQDIIESRVEKRTKGKVPFFFGQIYMFYNFHIFDIQINQFHNVFLYLSVV